MIKRKVIRFLFAKTREWSLLLDVWHERLRDCRVKCLRCNTKTTTVAKEICNECFWREYNATKIGS